MALTECGGYAFTSHNGSLYGNFAFCKKYYHHVKRDVILIAIVNISEYSAPTTRTTSPLQASPPSQQRSLLKFV
ncbi:hypothetical protein evm_008854 [Chilo suppressalis]|nr:hypothetical protein evm_008854 [Chilo suppressalis]